MIADDGGGKPRTRIFIGGCSKARVGDASVDVAVFGCLSARKIRQYRVACFLFGWHNFEFN